MRGKDYNAGLRGVLFEARHYQRMGAAVWLFGWLVLRQTHQQGEIGWVLGGAPISYREIEEETGFNVRTLEGWMRTLRRQGYIETEVAPSGIIVRITKAKKFPQAGRKFADGVRRTAGSATHNRVANQRNPVWNQQNADRIGSSFVARSQENSNTPDIHRDFHRKGENLDPQGENSSSKPSGLDQTQNPNRRFDSDFPANAHLQQQNKCFLEARLRQQLLRAEREEAVRRELSVGSGPEVPRS
jgi:hypothetical protein